MTETMQGFPVPIDQRIPRQDWDRAPWNRWSFQNVRQILPTTEVWRGDGPVWQLDSKAADLSSLPFANDDGLENIQQWLDTSFTDGLVVLHHGQIVFEQYQNNMTDRTLHLSQSMAKSVVGCVAGILIGRGDMNVDQLVSHYLPELEKTAWKGATLRQVLDMTTGVRYVEDYTALDSDIAMTDIASGWKLAPPGVEAPYCMWDQILGLTESVREHGALFQYRSIETDVLAHCLERVTQTRLAELVSREIWQPLGCEESANFTVDAVGYAMADGGLNATLRDYARFGQMLLQNGHANGRQIVPKDWIDDIHKADNRIFGEPYTLTAPNGGYRNQFWIQNVDKQAYMARGVFGQLIYVDPDHDMVVTKLSTWPEFTSVPRLKTALNAINAIGSFLNNC